MVEDPNRLAAAEAAAAEAKGKTVPELAVELEEARAAIVVIATTHVKQSKGHPDNFPRQLTGAVERCEALAQQLGLKVLEELRKGSGQGLVVGRVEEGTTHQALYDDPPADPPLPKPPPPAPPMEKPKCRSCSRTDGVQRCGVCEAYFCPEHIDPALHPCGDLTL